LKVRESFLRWVSGVLTNKEQVRQNGAGENISERRNSMYKGMKKGKHRKLWRVQNNIERSMRELVREKPGQISRDIHAKEL
jgi:ribosomal protein S2